MRVVWVAAPQGSGAGLVLDLHTSVTYCPGMLHISSKSFQQVNGEGLRTSSAGCPHRPPYAGSPGIEHINIASSQQVIAGGRRTSSAGCPDSQCIDILYAD